MTPADSKVNPSRPSRIRVWVSGVVNDGMRTWPSTGSDRRLAEPYHERHVVMGSPVLTIRPG